MYPEFVEVTTQENATAAIRTFTFALKVEAVHAVLYRDALDNLQKRTGKSHTYHVCPDCGNTIEELNIVKCLVCRHSSAALSRSASSATLVNLGAGQQLLTCKRVSASKAQVE
jgi:rubrerythrin